MNMIQTNQKKMQTVKKYRLCEISTLGVKKLTGMKLETKDVIYSGYLDVAKTR